MAVKQNKAYEGEVASYTGLSSDILPPWAGEGARAEFVDTGERWIFHDGMWVFDLNGRKLTQSVYS
jgi:hypothetical protein